MPVFIAALLGGVWQVLGSMVGRVLVSLGLSFVTYAGVSTLLEKAEQTIRENVSGLPADAVQFFGWMNLDKGLSMIFSAYGVSLIIRGVLANKLTKTIRSGT